MYTQPQAANNSFIILFGNFFFFPKWCTTWSEIANFLEPGNQDSVRSSLICSYHSCKRCSAMQNNIASCLLNIGEVIFQCDFYFILKYFTPGHSNLCSMWWLCPICQFMSDCIFKSLWGMISKLLWLILHSSNFTVGDVDYTCIKPRREVCWRLTQEEESIHYHQAMKFHSGRYFRELQRLDTFR